MGSTGDSSKVIQTKRIFADKFMELLEERPLKKISVNDICQSALMSRSAFYLYFRDKYQLLKYCFENEVRSWQDAAKDKSGEDAILYILDALLEKKRFFHHAFMDEPDREQVEILQSVFVSIFTKRLEEKERSGCALPGPASVLGAFYAGGIVSMNIQWIQSDFDIPKEEIAECQRRLLESVFGP